EESQPKSTQANVNPGYISPDQFRMRLQKLMDEYAGGVTSQFTTSGPLLQKGLELLKMLKEDSAFLGAKNLHELMRCWENYHRMYQAEAHVRTVLFREETRWPGYYFRSDKPKMDPSWLCFVNCTMDPKTEEWEMKKVPVKYLFA
ncbi:MAG TPA: adenylylsulfate reductase subunit alpha, partial [Candidatus Methylomirabilis sp.]|nr:adenylylsulfate reductase subunit alpha [Candidatus Methylomirabilis sp.]